METRLDDLLLPAAGRHNALNATAAIAVAHRLGVTAASIRDGLARFAGVKRRFTKTGEWNGVSIFDDYGHHPVEIAAVLRAARASTEGKVIAIMQPHRYTRLQSLFDQFAACFGDADVALIVADVYPAGETKIEGVDGPALARAATAQGHARARAFASPQELPGLVREIAAAGGLCGVSGRRRHHPMGLCAAGAIGGARAMTLARTLRTRAPSPIGGRRRPSRQRGSDEGPRRNAGLFVVLCSNAARHGDGHSSDPASRGHLLPRAGEGIAHGDRG